MGGAPGRGFPRSRASRSAAAAAQADRRDATSCRGKGVMQVMLGGSARAEPPGGMLRSKHSCTVLRHGLWDGTHSPSPCAWITHLLDKFCARGDSKKDGGIAACGRHHTRRVVPPLGYHAHAPPLLYRVEGATLGEVSPMVGLTCIDADVGEAGRWVSGRGLRPRCRGPCSRRWIGGPQAVQGLAGRSVWATTELFLVD